jgi:creatinine amidohydrolase
MQWENLTSPDFGNAARETGVCVLAAGVVEKHSNHLPLGTDFLNGHKIACLAAEIEPAVIFPPFYFGQIYEAKCFPGTITLKPTLLLELFFNVLDEIGRNGFRKIVIYNAHGGNNHLLGFLAQCSLWEEKPYAVYYAGRLSPERQQAWEALLETKLHYHACECETSITLANHPELVKMEQVPAEAFNPLGRLDHLPGSFSGISWYSNFPDHYAGDARPATREKGLALRQIAVEALAEFIAAVKQDQGVPGLNREFFERVRTVEGGR